MLVLYSAYERVAFTAINAVVESLGYITSLLRLFCHLQVPSPVRLVCPRQLPQAANFAVPRRLIFLQCGPASINSFMLTSPILSFDWSILQWAVNISVHR